MRERRHERQCNDRSTYRAGSVVLAVGRSSCVAHTRRFGAVASLSTAD